MYPLIICPMHLIFVLVGVYVDFLQHSQELLLLVKANTACTFFGRLLQSVALELSYVFRHEIFVQPCSC
jgi:hypothetical protein